MFYALLATNRKDLAVRIDLTLDLSGVLLDRMDQIVYFQQEGAKHPGYVIPEKLTCNPADGALKDKLIVPVQDLSVEQVATLLKDSKDFIGGATPPGVEVGDYELKLDVYPGMVIAFGSVKVDGRSVQFNSAPLLRKDIEKFLTGGE